MALLALLLKRKRPVSKAEIRRGIPDYARASAATFDRIFERDKKELREMGIDLRVMTVDGGREITDPREAARYQAQEIGYTIDREQYFLPQIDFEPGEWALISLALSLSNFGGRKDGGVWENLRTKLGCLRPPGLRPVFDDLAIASGTEKYEEQKFLPIIEEAITKSRSLDIEYYSIGRDQQSRRRVDPYLLLLYSGHWYLVGYCHLRQEVRMFKASRILKVKPGKENSYSLPEDFDRQAYLQRKPWELPVHQPYTVTLGLYPETAWLMKQELGPRTNLSPDGLEASFAVSNEPALVRWLCANCDRAVVKQPRELGEKVLKILDALAKEYDHGQV